MTTKKFVIMNAILSLVLLIILASSVSAWYVNKTKRETVDLSTNGIVLSYKLNSGTEINATTYDIDNLVFFDLDNENEGKYFTTMAILIKVDIENRSKKAVDITVSQGTTASETDPYVACCVASSALDSSETEKSVEGFLTDESVTTTYTTENVAALDEEENEGGKASFYVYVYGIQPDDSATNDFLGSYDDKATYPFKLVISAVVHAEE